MSGLASSVEQIIQNVLKLDAYSRGSESEKKFHAQRIKNGKLFVTTKHEERYLFAPSKFAGYENNDLHHADKLAVRDGRDTNRRITELLGLPCDDGSVTHKAIDAAFLAYCSGFSITPSKHHRPRRYWIAESFSLPDEIATSSGLWEGTTQQVLVNRYERSPEARRECISHYGCDCFVCGFNFEHAYGADLGGGYIHVHHLVPLSSIRAEYKIDPIKDLRPVCPNCHAMLHRGANPLSIDEMRENLQQQSQQRA